MKYFDLIDELFSFKYLLTEDDLLQLPDDIRKESEDLVVYISKNLIDFDQRLRIERNIKILTNVVKNMQFIESEIDSLDQLYHLIKLKSKTDSGQNVLITNSAIGFRIQDMAEFKPNNSRVVVPGYPIIAGTIGNLKVVIDPDLKSKENKIIFYDKNKVKVASYIKDFKIENEATLQPIVKSTITVFKLYHDLSLKIIVKIPIQQLI